MHAPRCRCQAHVPMNAHHSACEPAESVAMHCTADSRVCHRDRFLELDTLQPGWQVQLAGSDGGPVDATFFSPAGKACMLLKAHTLQLQIVIGTCQCLIWYLSAAQREVKASSKYSGPCLEFRYISKEQNVVQVSRWEPTQMPGELPCRPHETNKAPPAAVAFCYLQLH